MGDLYRMLQICHATDGPITQLVYRNIYGNFVAVDGLLDQVQQTMAATDTDSLAMPQAFPNTIQSYMIK